MCHGSKLAHYQLVRSLSNYQLGIGSIEYQLGSFQKITCTHNCNKTNMTNMLLAFPKRESTQLGQSKHSRVLKIEENRERSESPKENKHDVAILDVCYAIYTNIVYWPIRSTMYCKLRVDSSAMSVELGDQLRTWWTSSVT